MQEQQPTGSNTLKAFTVWEVNKLTREAATGIVREVEWSLSKLNTRKLMYKTGVVNLTGSSSDPNFIPFENLTQETVLGWITGSLNPKALYTELSSSWVDTKQPRSGSASGSVPIAGLGTPW